MRIQHNIMAMNAYRNYNTNTSALSKNLEKLSSGYKINRAGDDAAGLAISEKMRAQITGLEAAQKNVKDGVSLVKTAEGAMQEIQDMLNRMDYLATQSANGTYQDEVDRENLQLEVEQLRSEINRIADSANFNGIKLLDGSLDSTGMSKALAAAEAAQKTADDALADAANAKGEAVYGAEDEVTMLPESSTNKPVTTGPQTETILETDFKEAGKPGYTIDFNGITHVFNNPSSNTDTADDDAALTVSINGNKVALSEKEIADAMGGTVKQGDVADGKVIAKALAKKMKDANNEWSEAANTGTVTTANKYSVKVDGEKVILSAKDNLDTDPVRNGDTYIRGMKESTVAAVASVWTAGAITQSNGLSTAADSVAKIEYVDEDGNTQTAEIKFQTSATGADDDAKTANTFANLKAAIEADEGLNGLFTVGGNAAAMTLTAKEGGSTVKITKFEFTTKGGGLAMATGDAVNKVTTDGADEIDVGGKGYLPSGTPITIQNGKAAIDQLASTTLTFTAADLKDGTKIRLGDQEYTIAVGSDSRYKDVENAVYVDGLKDTDADYLQKISAKLVEVAKDNKTFTVGFTKDDGKIAIKQRQEVKADTDMSTMDKFKSYIGISQVDADATAASDKAAVEAAKADAAKLQETADKLKADAAKLVEGKDLTLQIGDTSDAFNQLGVSVGNMHTYAMGSEGKSIADIDVGTQTGAQEAVQVVKDAINYVSSVRGTLGATQNRLEHTANNLSVMAENIQDAESTIRDTDVAEEMMSYVKNNILVQSAQAMLAQANQVPQGVLQLLG